MNNTFIINIWKAFQDEYNLYLVMDYFRGGDLRYHIFYKEYFTQHQVKFIACNIILGLQFIHAKGIIHRDIKPQNIVFEEKGYLRITDFGIARAKSGKTLQANNQASGTPGYMAPEILFQKQYSFQSDFFALGVIVYEIIVGNRPYEGNRTDIREKIFKHQMQMKEEEVPQGWDPLLADFVNKLLKINPIQRLGYRGINQLKEHDWLLGTKWKKLEHKQIKAPFRPMVIIRYNESSEMELENKQRISSIQNEAFRDYDYNKIRIKKGLVKKMRKTSQPGLR